MAPTWAVPGLFICVFVYVFRYFWSEVFVHPFYPQKSSFQMLKDEWYFSRYFSSTLKYIIEHYEVYYI